MIELEIPKEPQRKSLAAILHAGESASNQWRQKYESVLQSDRWKKMRRLLFERAENKCERCGSVDGLQVHHLTYERLGQEKFCDLLVLCGRCHEIADRYREITNFGNWLNHEGKAKLMSGVPLPIPNPFDARKFVEDVELFRGRVVVTFSETRDYKDPTGWRRDGPDYIAIEWSNVYISLEKDRTKPGGLMDHYDEIEAFLRFRKP